MGRLKFGIEFAHLWKTVVDTNDAGVMAAQ